MNANPSTIKALEQEQRRLYGQLRYVEDKLRRARLAASPVRVGDIVRGTSDQKLYRVTEVKFTCGSAKPWVTGNPQRKDGSYGTAIRYLYTDWTLEKKGPGWADQSGPPTPEE